MEKQIKDCILIERFVCNENDSIIDIAKKLKIITLNHIFVLDENEYPVGIISITDMNNRVIAEGKNPTELTAKDIMSKVGLIATTEDNVDQITEKAKEKNHMFTPVTQNNKMVGIITAHQLLLNCKDK
ncbi:MAG: CBS domain-containing protein [Patescibacteria group bacterium]|jgi:CBS domain-containing protein